MVEQYFAYVIKSQKDGRLYKGMSSDLDRRINEHNMGNNKSTKSYCPWILVYSEQFGTRKEASNREKYLKSGIGREYLKNILAP